MVSEASTRRRIRIGYMRIREFRGLMKIEIVPISREEALKLLRGERRAGEGEARDKV